MIDLLGMGCSGRPEYDAKKVGTAEKVADYFTIMLEAYLVSSKYRESVGADQGYILAGHSLGGYLAVNYYLSQYVQGYIKKLILLSPVGIPREPTAE